MVRYADILLMYAEAQTEYLNKAQGASIINDELVYKSIEMVRQRAGLNPYTLKRGMSYDQLIKLIRNERRCGIFVGGKLLTTFTPNHCMA